jgi:serine/threonine-protein kinase
MGTRDLTEPQGGSPIKDEEGRAGRVGLVGKTLGRYRISAELGRGGMATVYRAYDPQLARDVAVKVMHGAFTGRGDIERRFRREAQAVASLKHDCIVDVFDFAPGGDGEPAYIVSELVEGPTLRQLLEQAGGRLPPEIAVVVASRVAAALAAAHARGIVHRDVKPDNVMIDFGKGGARVLLTDFGIARMVEDDTMTATGSILGSPSYMSPEQARSGTIEPASDVFSLGVTLYHMVVGRTPFQGKDPLTVIASLVSGEYLRPGRVEARVGPELEALIVRCLKHQAAERYADGNQLLSALRELTAATAPAIVASDEAAALRSFRDDPKELERRLAAPVADACVERARAAIRRGELTKALAQINRAVAYAPGHRGAEALLAAISSRRRWTKFVAAGATLAVVGGAVVGARSLVRRAPPREAARVERPSPPSAPPAASPPTPVAVRVPEVPAAATTSAAARRDERAPPRKRERIKRSVAPAAPVAAAPVASPPPAVVAPPSPPPPVVVEAPPPAPRPAPTAGITLRARQGFCSPSLDDRAPALRPIYEGVPVGRHQVFCTLPGGTRELAGSYELRAGTHPDLIIVPGPDGHPTLGRPE